MFGSTTTVMKPTAHCGMMGATIGMEVFTNLGYADDVSLLAQVVEAVRVL